MLKQSHQTPLSQVIRSPHQAPQRDALSLDRSLQYQRRIAVAPDPTTRPQKGMGFRDGFICVALNPKIHSMIVVMFAQFLTPGASLASQVTQLSAAFVVLRLFCHFPWIYGGLVILGRFNTPHAVRIQAAVFGASMLAVAAYVVLSQVSVLGTASNAHEKGRRSRRPFLLLLPELLSGHA